MVPLLPKWPQIFRLGSTLEWFEIQPLAALWADLCEKDKQKTKGDFLIEKQMELTSILEGLS